MLRGKPSSRNFNVGRMENKTCLRNISGNGLLKNCSSPASPLFLDCARNDHMLMTNASSIRTESGNLRECIQELKRPSSHVSIKMHAQREYVSSKLIEMGIRFLDGVNEMRPDEMKMHLTLRAIYRFQRKLRKKMVGAALRQINI